MMMSFNWEVIGFICQKDMYLMYLPAPNVTKSVHTKLRGILCTMVNDKGKHHNLILKLIMVFLLLKLKQFLIINNVLPEKEICFFCLCYLEVI